MAEETFTRRGLLQGATALATAAFMARDASAQRFVRAAGTTGAPLPGRGELLIRGAAVLTMDPAVGDLTVGDVHVREGAIVAVGPGIVAPAAEVIDGVGMV